MRRNGIIFVIITSLLLSGCLVGSLHPYYKLKDKIYDPSIAGTYIDKDSCLWVIKQNKVLENLFSNTQPIPDSTYAVTYFENDSAASSLQATLFVLNGQKYVDFVPDPSKQHFTTDMTGFHFVPVHTLARFQNDGDTLMLFWYGEKWLDDLFAKNRIWIEHEKLEYGNANGIAYRSNILTADTDDLQKFILKYMNEEKVLKEIEDAFTMGKEVDDHVFVKLYPHHGTEPSKQRK